MRTTRAGGSFLVIGENVHATRTVSRRGRLVVRRPDGREAVAFTDEHGADRSFAIPDAVSAGQEFAAGRVKHVRAAILVGMGGGPEAADAAAYLRSMVRRQVDGGADWIDLNVDEVSPDPGEQAAAMAWLVETVEPTAGVPVALDSSTHGTIEAGLRASRSGHGRPLLNSASLERIEVLDLAARDRCPVVVTAASGGGLPAGADERVANTERIVAEAVARGLSLPDLHVDALVMPIAVDPDTGTHYLDAVRRIRAAFGPGIHVTGGLSNVSFGLPARRLVNAVFIDMAAEAGVDCGIVDPVASDLGRVFGMDRSSVPYRMASDLLTGADPYGMEFLTAFRAGTLGEP